MGGQASLRGSQRSAARGLRGHRAVLQARGGERRSFENGQGSGLEGLAMFPSQFSS